MNFIEWLKVILLGIVEGITEWLPISSTGHLILTDAIWPLQQSDAFKEMFNVVIQLGAILAVVVLYWSKLWPFHRKRIPQRSWFAQQSTNGFVGGLQRFGDRYCCMDKIVMWLKIAVSCLPAMLIGLPLNDWLDKHFYNPTVVALMLLLYGAGFLFVERYNRSRKPRVNSIASLRWSDALLIGVFQVLALIPGTSRSGATILGGILIGTSREVAAEYTFFLAIPIMFGWGVVKAAKFMMEGLVMTQTEIMVLVVGIISAFIMSVVAIRFLMGYIKKNDFTAFGVYRIIVGIIVVAFFTVQGTGFIMQ